MATNRAEVARLHGEGQTRDEIASRLSLRARTVTKYLHDARKAAGQSRRNHYMRAPLRERFAAKVDVNGPVPEHRPELGPCHVWTAGLGSHGYGEITDTRGEIGPAGMKYRVHRVAVMLRGVALTDDVVVMHECDRPACVRIEHLKVGTQRANLADRDAKGRTARKLDLTDDLRARVTELRAAGFSYKRIALKLGINRTTLTRALSRAA